MGKNMEKCSFCGNNRQACGLLIAGPDCYICEWCVVVCVRLLADQAKLRSVPVIDVNGEEVRKEAKADG